MSKLVVVSRSLTYNKNKSGPSANPCEILQVTLANSDISPQKFRFRYCFCSLKKFFNNSNGAPQMPKWVLNFCSKTLFFLTLLKEVVL